MTNNQEQRDLSENSIHLTIDQIVGETGTGADAVIPILHSIQNKFAEWRIAEA